MILHLFDDEKVVSRAVDLFEEAIPRRNIFVVKVIGTPRYLVTNDRIFLYRDGDVINVKDYDNIDCIIIHSLQIWKIDFILSLGRRPKTIWWCVWGADMYNSILNHLGYRMVYEPQYVQNSFKIKISTILSKIGIYTPSLKKQLLFIRDYVTHLKTSKEEYDIQKSFLGSFLNADYCEVPINLYYSINNILSQQLLESRVSGNIILVGNSASVSNNHIYAYKFLKKLDIGDRQVVSPLSYGGNKKYRDHVVSKANILFKSKFIPLLDFMPLEDYNKILLQAVICIYGNWRQEAMGNIIISLYLGAKVFLSKKSPLLKRFHRMGVKIFCLEDITQSELDTPLSNQEIVDNRKIIFSSFNKDAIINGITQSWR